MRGILLPAVGISADTAAASASGKYSATLITVVGMTENTEGKGAETTDEGVLSPGTTATGGGTSIGTTEADVTDGREQKLPKAD